MRSRATCDVEPRWWQQFEEVPSAVHSEAEFCKMSAQSQARALEVRACPRMSRVCSSTRNCSRCTGAGSCASAGITVRHIQVVVIACLGDHSKCRKISMTS